MKEIIEFHLESGLLISCDGDIWKHSQISESRLRILDLMKESFKFIFCERFGIIWRFQNQTALC